LRCDRGSERQEHAQHRDDCENQPFLRFHV
jgi:hypothetical protein